MEFKKLVTYGIAESALSPEYWEKVDGLTDKRAFLDKNSNDFLKEMADADALLVSFGTVIDADTIDASPQLRYIGIAATAYNKVNVAYAKTKNIIVTNLPGYSTESVAEFTIAAILEQMRQLEKGKNNGRQGNYDESEFSAREIQHKNFGVLGLGQIGHRVAEIALGFSANVFYWSKHHHLEAEQKGIRFSELDQLAQSSDILSLNVALNVETTKILNKLRIQSLKPGAIVINTAPMELVDLDALADRLQQGDITFILDHSDQMTKEDITKITSPHCIIYPPIAYVSQEARTNKQNLLVENVERFLAGRPQNVVS